LRLTGIPLGILPEMEWKSSRTRFQPGDLLVLYTDGVTEAEDECNDFYGSERLIETVRGSLGKSAQEIHDTVIRGLCEFAGSLSVSDDITLMVLARERTSA
jgi:sigma-B regulation protein RsbU (phosphoserine phosphatase)